MSQPIDYRSSPSTAVGDSPGLLRRLACIVYEALLIIAVVFIATFLFSGLSHYQGTGPLRLAFQVYLIIIMGGYFTWFWSRGRRTLAMKTWQLRIIEKNGTPLTPKKAFLRYCLAWLCVTGIGLLWAVIDREGLFLHDRLAGTRLIITKD
ncbi:MAG: RDD family protein [Pseudomonadota bacterium]